VSSDFLDDIHQDIAEFADRHLEEDEREAFVDALLERKGYVRQSTWAPPEPSQGGGGGRQPLLRQGGGQRGGGQGKQQPRAGSYFKGK
jgi:hypothetical protein